MPPSNPPTETTLSPLQLHRTFECMARYGGHFCSLLSAAWMAGDTFHRSCIEQAFPHLLSKYGPGSAFYTSCHPEAA